MSTARVRSRERALTAEEAAQLVVGDVLDDEVDDDDDFDDFLTLEEFEEDIAGNDSSDTQGSASAHPSDCLLYTSPSPRDS